MIILGIDPGLSGALTFYDSVENAITVHDMPTLSVKRNGKDRRIVSPHLVADIITSAPKVDMALLEQVSARPGEAATASFAFGRGVGMLEGVLAALGVPYKTVPPANWKKALKLNQGKDANRLACMQMWPDHSDIFKRVKDDGRADATLIALYGHKEALTGQPRPHIV